MQTDLDFELGWWWGPVRWLPGAIGLLALSATVVAAERRARSPRLFAYGVWPLAIAGSVVWPLAVAAGVNIYSTSTARVITIWVYAVVVAFGLADAVVSRRPTQCALRAGLLTWASAAVYGLIVEYKEVILFGATAAVIAMPVAAVISMIARRVRAVRE
jgi:hypothetical protein